MDLEFINTQVLQAQKGDQESSYLLWEHLSPIWEKWKRSTHLPDWEGEDLKQQSYLILLEALHKYNTTDHMNFPGFYKVRLHIWRYRLLRRPALIKETSETASRLLEELPDTLDIAHQVETKLLATLALQQLRNLKPEDRRLLTLTLIQEVKIEEVAKYLGITANSVSVKKKRLCAKIKKYI